MQPRGLRNNNPLNVRKSSQPWRGKITPGTDPDFEQFVSLEYGLRCAFVIIRTYIKKYRLDTPAKIVQRWAPPTENNTNSYIANVTRISLLDPNRRLEVSQKNALCRLVWAMAQVECGQPVSFGRIENAYALAFGRP